MTKRENSLACALHNLKERYLPCPDHRDKHRTGDECLACQRDRVQGRFEIAAEAARVLDLIVAEFTSDPMSVQCFAKSIVNDAKLAVQNAKVRGIVDEAWKNYNYEKANGGRRSG